MRLKSENDDIYTNVFDLFSTYFHRWVSCNY